MTAARDIIAVLIAGGMNAVEAAELMARAVVEMTATRPSKGALRTRAWRERLASQSVTCDAVKAADSPNGENVSERHKPSQSVTGDKVPLSLRNNTQETNQERGARKRGTRLGDAWQPTDQDWQAAVVGFGEAGARTILAKFRDHWKADPGARAVKLDWNATFRNWCRNEINFSNRGGGNGKRTSPGQTGHNAILAAASRKARELVVQSGLAGAADEIPPARRMGVEQVAAERGEGTPRGIGGGHQWDLPRSAECFEGPFDAAHQNATELSSPR
jgi:hypothetical protein